MQLVERVADAAREAMTGGLLAKEHASDGVPPPSNLPGQDAEELRLARAEIETLRAQLDFLSHASVILTASLDYETTLQSVAHLAVPRTADWCAITLVENGKQRELVVAHVDPEKVRLARELQDRYPPDPEARTGVAEVIRTGRSELYPVIPDEMLAAAAVDAEHLQLIREVGLVSAMVVPLVARGATLGAVTLVTAESGRHYGPADLALAEELAQRCAQSIDNARLYQQLQAELVARERVEEERAQLLAKEEVARTKDELVGVVSHELRTPLAAMVGFAELLLARDYSVEKQREFLSIMHHEGKRLTALINDFLDLQRMESGRDEVRPRPSDLAQLMAQAVANVGEDPRCPMLIEAEANLPPVLADADRISQVLANLLSNARKYSPQGGTVRCSARVAGQMVEVAVEDEGLGIPEDALPHLFEKFYRVDNSDRRAITGTGLGLAISKQIVEAHGGHIWAASGGLRRGSRFAFSLPLAGGEASPDRLVPPLATSAPEPPAAAAVPDHQADYVLVVENDPAYAAWLRQVLLETGYAVRVAMSATDALEIVADARPAAVLLDLRLQDTLDGWDLLSILRGRPSTADVPVIVVTMVEDPSGRQALGINDYFVKPIGREQLLGSMERLAIPRDRVVLVVEDDPGARRLASESLQKAGWRVRAVASGEEALALLDAGTEAAGLMVLDLALPGMDGFAVLDALGERPAARGLPVVVFTGRELSRDEKAFLSTRVQQVVHKGNGVPIQEAVGRALGASSNAGAASA